ncbi:MAG TPA: aminotransferase class V-fold PLP-dependent enzyme [Steroidobacteraceae bacterium]|nr:aminotransferase class V-fold PLP-dependent enzyme [Steroidobacteraceae bacterium]
MDERVLHWREDTPGVARRVHLNNAGAALMPSRVLGAITDHLQLELLHGGYEAEDEAAESVHNAYAAVASLIGASPANVAIVENATVAFYQALSCFDFQRGDVIVTTRNDYISNQLAYLSLARRCGVVVHRAEDLAAGGVDPDSVCDMLRNPRVRLLAVTWVPTNSGLIQPVAALGEIAAAAGVPYLIDACQAVGQLPIDVAKLRCDFLAATARKFLRGPRGIGFLYASDRVLERGQYPLYIDMRGANWQTPDTFSLAVDARRFENWEFSYGLVLGLGEAARYAAEVGVARGGARARALAAKTRLKLADLAGFRVLDQGADLAAIVTVEIRGRYAPDVMNELRARGINTSAAVRDHSIIDMDQKRAASALRISPHYYNTEAEIDLVCDALRV